MKKTFLLIILLSSILFSQKTFNYTSERIVQKDNSTNAVVAESDSPVVVTFLMYDDKTGYLNFSSGAFVTLYQFNGGDGVFNWYWFALDKNKIRCNVQLNTSLEEDAGIVYINVQYSDYTFYYKLVAN
jgi:hypothetical protein